MLQPKSQGGSLSLTFSFVWILVLSNLITVSICFLFLNQLAKITQVRGSRVIPFILLLIYLGGFAENNTFQDLLVVLLFGALGWVMVELDWPCPLGWSLWEAREWWFRARLFPWAIGFAGLALALTQLYLDARSVGKANNQLAPEKPRAESRLVRSGTLAIAVWILGFFIAIWLLGFPILSPISRSAAENDGPSPSP